LKLRGAKIAEDPRNINTTNTVMRATQDFPSAHVLIAKEGVTRSKVAKSGFASLAPSTSRTKR